MRSVGAARTVSLIAVSLVAATLPVFLLSALSPRIGAELGLDEATLGLAVSGFFLAAAGSSLPGGIVADRRGAATALRTGLIIAACGAMAVVMAARSGITVIVWLAVTGTSIGFVDTAGARSIAAAVPLPRHGLAFGAKEASIPAASMLAGISVPVLGERLGWRPAFVLAAVVALTVAVLIPGGIDRSPPTGGRPAAPPADGVSAPTGGPTWPLLTLAVTAALGGGAAAAAATFLVPAAVARGWSEAAAGGLLAAASIVGVVARLGAGSLADRGEHGELRILAVATALGALGMVGLASDVTALVVPAALLALGAGWGWTGLVFLAAVRIAPGGPAKAAASVLMGLGIGGALGPGGFGWLVSASGYDVAWLAATVAMGVASVLALTTDRTRAKLII